MNHLAAGEAPSFLQPFLAGGVSIALRKGATGIRPLCCGDPLRRLVAKCFCFGGKRDIDKVFKRKNYGVGCPGGIEVVAHSLRDVLGRYADSRMALLKIDFRNAFNRVDRATFMHASCGMFPPRQVDELVLWAAVGSSIRSQARDPLDSGSPAG